MSYFIWLFLNIFAFIGLIILFYLLIKSRKEKGGINEEPFIKKVGYILVLIALIILFGIGSIMYLRDLPSILSNKPIEYEGDCEVAVIHGKYGSMQVEFKNTIVEFPTNFYSNAEDGNYFCKVRYFKHSGEGKSLKLFYNKGGNQIDIK